MDVSICLISQGDTYILQRRADNAAKGAAGLIGAFGGKIETGESPVEAVCRELSEETSLRPTTDDFDYLGKVEVISDRDHRPVLIMASVFRLLLPPHVGVVASEGNVVNIAKSETITLASEMTPATKAAFVQYVEGEK